MKHKSALKRGVYIRQHDEKDCGPACLCSVCRYYGYRVSIAKVRQLSSCDSQGTSVRGLVEAADKLGFEAKSLFGNRDEFEHAYETGEIEFPVIAHLATPEQLLHYVVVLAFKNDYFLLADPAVGRRKLEKTLFYEQWTGVLITLQVAGKLDIAYETNSILSYVLPIARQNIGIIAISLLVSVALTAVGVASAFLFQVVIDDVVLRLGVESELAIAGSLMLVCGLVTVLYVFQAVLTSARSHLLATFAKRIDASIMMGFFGKLVSLPLSFFVVRKTGEILSRFSDATKIREAISSIAITSLVDCVLIVGGTAVLFAISWKLALVACALFLSYGLVVFFCIGKLRDSNTKLMERNAQLQSYLKESIDGIETIKAFCQEGEAEKEVQKRFQSVLKQAFKMNVLVANQNAIVSLLYSLSTIGIIWIGVNQIIEGGLTLGELITFNALVGFFMEPVQRVVGLQSEIQSAAIAYSRLNDVNELDSEETEEGITDVDVKAPIVFRGVNFRYGVGENVLSEIDLTIMPGEKIALVGESGSGKTTLARLLLAFYQAESGSIAIGETPITEVRKSYLRGRIAYLSQEPFIFSGTIAENILYGHKDITDKSFARVCQLCCIADFVEKLPLGFRTVVEEGGGNLSGGQRQRIALARSLMGDPDVLILDEATSNLDSKTEQKVLDGISALTANSTVILVAHRLDTVVQCDRVVLMEDGRIVESGSHDALLDAGGHYAKYWRTQNRARREKASEAHSYPVIGN